MEAHDLAAAIAEDDRAMEPARAHDVKLARRLVLADDDGAAAEAAVLLLEPLERIPFARGQADVMAESLS
jgi:hypothetical protein